MKTKIFLLLTFLILAVSCSKNNSLNPSGITIANYEGTYTGKAKYKAAGSSAALTEEDVSLIVNKNGAVIFKTTSKDFTFNSFSKTDDKSFNSMKSENNSTLILALVFDGNGNVNVSFTIQDNTQGTSEIYTADKLTKTAS